MNGRSRLAAAVAVLALTGCTHLSVADKGPRTDPVVRLVQTTPPPWREDFGDPVLTALLARADAASIDGKLALARLAKADAEIEAADAARSVNVVAGLSAAVGEANFHSARGAATPTLEVRNELDVWGRLAHGREAARAQRSATAADLEAARMQIGAETARSYMALAAARESLASAATREAAARDAVDRTMFQKSQGSASDHDVAMRHAELISASAAKARAAARADLEAARLADLVGGPAPTPGSAALEAPGLAAPPAPVASSIVDRRPDVRAAAARIRAADEQRAAAVAASRPQFQIAAALGAPDANIATLLDIRALAWAAAASLSHEILDGGAQRARVHIATADADIADLSYRQTVLAGWQEIRTAVFQAADARRGLEAADASAAAARLALAVGERRHAAGVLDGVGLADLRHASADADQAAIEARLNYGLARISLALAEGPA